MITVKVIRQSSGQPVQGVAVSLGFDGFSRGVTNRQNTDRNGEAHFTADNGNGQVYIDGRTRQRGYLSGRMVVYI